MNVNNAGGVLSVRPGKGRRSAPRCIPPKACALCWRCQHHHSAGQGGPKISSTGFKASSSSCGVKPSWPESSQHRRSWFQVITTPRPALITSGIWRGGSSVPGKRSCPASSAFNGGAWLVPYRLRLGVNLNQPLAVKVITCGLHRFQKGIINPDNHCSVPSSLKGFSSSSVSLWVNLKTLIPWQSFTL